MSVVQNMDFDGFAFSLSCLRHSSTFSSASKWVSWIGVCTKMSSMYQRMPSNFVIAWCMSFANEADALRCPLRPMDTQVNLYLALCPGTVNAVYGLDSSFSSCSQKPNVKSI